MWKGPSCFGYDIPEKVALGYIRKQSERVWGASLSKQCSSKCIKGDDSCLRDFWVCSLAQTKNWMTRKFRKLNYWGKKRKENLGHSECENPKLNFFFLTTKLLAREAPEPLNNTSSWHSYLLPIRSAWENPTGDTQLDARYRSVKQELSWKLPPPG